MHSMLHVPITSLKPMNVRKIAQISISPLVGVVIFQMGNVTCTGRVEKWWAKKREHIEPLAVLAGSDGCPDDNFLTKSDGHDISHHI